MCEKKQRPEDFLLHPPVDRAADLLWGIPKRDLQDHQDEILLVAQGARVAHETAELVALRKTETIIVRLDHQVQLPLATLE